MTFAQDMFVGVVAVVIGALLVIGAVLDATHLMALAKPRMLTEALGKTAARCVIGAIGALVIGMGVLIASGWRVAW